MRFGMQLLGLMAVMYTIEPLLGRLYVSRALRAAESVITQVQVEVFRVLLMQPISFYDRHSTTEITNSLAVDCLLYTSPSPRDRQKSRMPSSA